MFKTSFVCKILWRWCGLEGYGFWQKFTNILKHACHNGCMRWICLHCLFCILQAWIPSIRVKSAKFANSRDQTQSTSSIEGITFLWIQILLIQNQTTGTIWTQRIFILISLFCRKLALLYRMFLQFSIWIPLNVPNILCGLHPHFVNYICIMWLIINMQLHHKLWFNNECKNVFMVCLCIVYGRTVCHCFDTSWHLLIISVYCIKLFLWTKYWDITLHSVKKMNGLDQQLFNQTKLVNCMQLV